MGRLRLRASTRRGTRILYTVNEGGLHAPLRPRREDAASRSRCRSSRRAPTTSTPARRRRTAASPRSASRPRRRPRTSYVYDWKTGTLTRWVVPSAPEVDTTHVRRRDARELPGARRHEDPRLRAAPEELRRRRPARSSSSSTAAPRGRRQPGFSTVRAALRRRRLRLRRAQRARQRRLRQDVARRRQRARSGSASSPTSRTPRPGPARPSRPDGKAPKVGVMGGSYGGYSALDRR